MSVAFMTGLENEIRARAGSDAMSVEWVDIRDLDLAFDHARIFADAKTKLAEAETSLDRRMRSP